MPSRRWAAVARGLSDEGLAPGPCPLMRSGEFTSFSVGSGARRPVAAEASEGLLFPAMRMLSVLLVLSAAAASAQTSRWASADDKTAVWMISQERRWAESACDGNDVVRTLLAEDFQGTSPSGTRYSKPTTPEKPSARDCKLGEVKIRFFGDNLAIAYGSESRVKTSKDGKDYVETLIWTDTWLKRNGRWQIIAAEDLIPAK